MLLGRTIESAGHRLHSFISTVRSMVPGRTETSLHLILTKAPSSYAASIYLAGKLAGTVIAGRTLLRGWSPPAFLTSFLFSDGVMGEAKTPWAHTQ